MTFPELTRRDGRPELPPAFSKDMRPCAGAPRFAAEVERRVREVFARVNRGRPPLQPNVEINAALLLDAVGIPREAFTPVFAIGRCPGWLAHAMEQQKTGRLIRPSSAHLGPIPASADR